MTFLIFLFVITVVLQSAECRDSRSAPVVTAHTGAHLISGSRRITVNGVFGFSFARFSFVVFVHPLVCEREIVSSIFGKFFVLSL